jgi:hypothetical protein
MGWSSKLFSIGKPETAQYPYAGRTPVEHLPVGSRQPVSPAWTRTTGIQRGFDARLYGAADLLTNASPSTSLPERSPRPCRRPSCSPRQVQRWGNAEEDATGGSTLVPLRRSNCGSCRTPPRCAPSRSNGSEGDRFPGQHVLR